MFNHGGNNNNHHHSNKHSDRAGLGSNLTTKRQSSNHRQTIHFGTPIFDGDEENEKELKAHNQERYTSEHQQYATDENGRRRFHGAFTGGFSAGYFNTVGSKEGWNPSNDFKTERRITDFMDEDDMKDIFGMSGSKQVQATDKFMKVPATSSNSNSSSNRSMAFSDPISDLFGGQITSSDQRHLEALFGGSVSEKLINLTDNSRNDFLSTDSNNNNTNIGYSLLKKMGWIPSKGIGIKSYHPHSSDSTTSTRIARGGIVRIKEDKCGIGYIHETLSDILHVEKPASALITTSQQQRVNKKKNIEEEEYYQQDDMSKYDIDLKSTPITVQEGGAEENSTSCWDEKLIFIKSKQAFSNQTKYLAPKVPEDFVPNHVFNIELIKKEYKKLDHKIQLHLMAAEERRRRLFESTTNQSNLQQQQQFNSRRTEKSREIQQQLSKAMSNRFVVPSSSSLNENTISSTGDNNAPTTSSSLVVNTNVVEQKTINRRERSRVISDWQPDPLVSKRFGWNPIVVSNQKGTAAATSNTAQKQSDILAKAFISADQQQLQGGETLGPTNVVKNQEKIEEGTTRPSMDLFKQVFEYSKFKNVIDQDEEMIPSNRIRSTPLQQHSEKKSSTEEEDVLSFDSVNNLKDIVKELKESKKGEGSSSSLIEKRKAVLESMKKSSSNNKPKEQGEQKKETTAVVVEKRTEKKPLDFNVYPMKRDSTSSYIAQLESRISDIRKLLDSSDDDEEKKKRKKHKKEKKEKKKRKKEYDLS